MVCGQIATANKIIIPALAAVKFPDLDVSYSDGTPLKLPVCSSGDVANADKAAIPKVSLVCLTFRASSQVLRILALLFGICSMQFPHQT